MTRNLWHDANFEKQLTCIVDVATLIAFGPIFLEKEHLPFTPLLLLFRKFNNKHHLKKNKHIVSQ